MSFKSLSKIEGLIERMIKEMDGSDNVVHFLELVINGEREISDRVSVYITLAVANYFKISTEELIDEGGRGRIEGSYRLICYQLHKDVLEYSIRDIMKVYKRKENAVWRGLMRMDDINKNPKIDIEIYNGFMKVKEHVVKFKNYLEEYKKDKKHGEE